ncbi:MAG: 6,7-dimethyl-8-ribityllumazine synthase [Bacteroidales bacterium]|nr:6,7-dimethyl-8-ribityllumazine synthase [Bacteroidales bacterium]
MATSLKNLSSYDPEKVPDAGKMKFGIVVSEWNEEITAAMAEGAIETLKKHGAVEENIHLITVPGSFELIFGSRLLAEKHALDAVIAIGCIIQGETRHFDFICQGVTQGMAELNLEYDIPFIFGVLTTQNQPQAIDRAGGKHGNKGNEAAITAIKMAGLNS